VGWNFPIGVRMATKFKPGNLVSLKSGSPPLTVEKPEGDGCWCTWFDGAKREHAFFATKVLIAVDSNLTTEDRARALAAPVEKTKHDK
jgi:uncharacterized protein YodC (DUF2158 family)